MDEQIIKQPTASALTFENTAVAFASRSDYQLRKMKWLFTMMSKPWLVRLGSKMLRLAFRLRLPIEGIVRHTVFEQFCGGETIEECERTVQELASAGIGTILDYSVEGEKTETGFVKTQQEILRTVERAAQAEEIPFSVFKVTGVASFPLLSKVQAGISLTAQEQAAWERAQARVDEICRKAYELGVRIFIDAEETWIQHTIDKLTLEMMRRYNKEQVIVYNTYQFYTKAALPNLIRDLAVAEAEGFVLGAKFVRGAYMEKERARAEEKGYPDPIQDTKANSDKDFDEALSIAVKNYKKLAICAGTHNEASSLLLANLMAKHQIEPNHPHFYFAQLYGMSDNISYNLANRGYNVAKYVPYGAIKSVLPYLIRRAEENTAVAGQTGREHTLILRELQRRK
ncbi:MAG: proline dehydrogenase family protein [Bernardetiaceae bacterium]|nr:proline dehydrogenase family protein [Bernardetiaceae bacterium]